MVVRPPLQCLLRTPPHPLNRGLGSLPAPVLPGSQCLHGYCHWSFRATVGQARASHFPNRQRGWFPLSLAVFPWPVLKENTEGQAWMTSGWVFLLPHPLWQPRHCCQGNLVRLPLRPLRKSSFPEASRSSHGSGPSGPAPQRTRPAWACLHSCGNRNWCR